MNWYRPDFEVTLDDQVFTENVEQMVVTASRNQWLTTIELSMSNVRFELADIEDNLNVGNCPISVKAGYRGLELWPIFTGTVARFNFRERLRLVGVCKAKALTTRLTRTYDQEVATAIVKHLTEQLGFTSVDLAEVREILDRLPMEDSMIGDGIAWLTRRMGLPYSQYCDPVGGYHWGPEDLEQEAAAVFTHGEDIIEWVTVAGGRKLLTVAGVNVWHSQVVEVIDGVVVERYFVEQVRHSVNLVGEGFRSQLWLRGI